MKFNPKSVFITMAAFALAGLLLTGCADNDPSTFPHVFNGIEVPKDVLDQPRVVNTPKNNDFSGQPYPRLGDVPAKPKTFSPQPVLDQAMSEMEFDRAQAAKANRDYQNTQPIIGGQPY